MAPMNVSDFLHARRRKRAKRSSFGSTSSSGARRSPTMPPLDLVVTHPSIETATTIDNLDAESTSVSPTTRKDGDDSSNKFPVSTAEKHHVNRQERRHRHSLSFDDDDGDGDDKEDELLAIAPTSRIVSKRTAKIDCNEKNDKEKHKKTTAKTTTTFRQESKEKPPPSDADKNTINEPKATTTNTSNKNESSTLKTLKHNKKDSSLLEARATQQMAPPALSSTTTKTTVKAVRSPQETGGATGANKDSTAKFNPKSCHQKKPPRTKFLVETSKTAPTRRNDAGSSLGTDKSSDGATTTFPQKQQDTIKDQGGWSCPKCTLHNEYRVRRCVMCGNRRPPNEYGSDAGSVLSQRSSNTTPKSSPLPGRVSHRRRSKDTTPQLSDIALENCQTPDEESKTQQSPKKRRRSPSSKRGKQSQSPAKKSKTAKKSRVSTTTSNNAPKESDISGGSCSDSKNLSAALHGEPEIAAQPMECETSQLNRLPKEDLQVAPETAKALPKELTEGNDQTLELAIKPIPGEKHPPASGETNKEQISRQNPIHVNEMMDSLRVENQSLRLQVERLQKQVHELRSSRQSLLDRFFAKTIESMGNVKQDFVLRESLSDSFGTDNSPLGQEPLRLASKLQSRTPKPDAKDNSLRVDSDMVSPLHYHSVESPDGKAIPRCVGKASPSEHVPHATVTGRPARVSKSPQAASLNSFNSKTEENSSAASVENASSQSRNVPSPSRDEIKTPNQRRDVSESQTTVGSAGDIGSLPDSQSTSSPAHSTQTMDPTVNKVPDKSVCYKVTLANDKNQEGSGGKNPKQTMQLSQPGSPRPNGRSNAREPPSPAHSTQTMDPTVSKRIGHNTTPKGSLRNVRRRKSDGEICNQQKSMLPPSVVRINKRPTYCVAHTSETGPSTGNKNLANGNESSVDSSTRETNRGKILPHELPTPITTTQCSPVSNPAQSRDAVGAISPKAMGPPLNRSNDRPLGNSTNKQTSAAWTSNASNKSFLSHLERTSGSVSGPDRRKSTTNAWTTTTRPVKPPSKQSTGSSNIWDDSQETNPQFEYQEVVRCKAKRQGLPCRDCPDCRAFYECLQRTGHAFSQDPFLMQHSRHRAQFTPPETPADFWEIEFTDEKREAVKTAEKHKKP